MVALSDFSSTIKDIHFNYSQNKSPIRHLINSYTDLDEAISFHIFSSSPPTASNKSPVEMDPRQQWMYLIWPVASSFSVATYSASGSVRTDKRGKQLQSAL